MHSKREQNDSNSASASRIFSLDTQDDDKSLEANTNGLQHSSSSLEMIPCMQ